MPPKAFRTDRRKYGFTWARPKDAAGNPLPQPIQTHQELIELIEQVGGSCLYAVSRELHKDGTVHWHAWVAYDAKVETTNERLWDCKGVHPNILMPRGGWLLYVKKDKDVVTNMEPGSFGKALAADSAEEALEMLWKMEPEKMAVHGHNIERNIKKRMRKPVAPPAPYCGPYPHVVDWPENKCLFIWGGAGLGKTQFAKYLLGEHFYVKGSLEALRHWDGSQPIIFDEWPYNDPKHNQQKVLLDMQDGAYVMLSHNATVFIPAGTKKVFISNDPPENVWDQTDWAVQRRLVQYHFE